MRCGTIPNAFRVTTIRFKSGKGNVPICVITRQNPLRAIYEGRMSNARLASATLVLP